MTQETTNTYTPEQLAAMIDEHRRWIRGEDGAKRLDLTRANLYGANLYGANLDGAHVRGCRVSVAPIMISNGPWLVTITDEHIVIGCQAHTTEEWAAYDDARLSEMDDEAPTQWAAWKNAILAMAEAHQRPIWERKAVESEVQA